MNNRVLVTGANGYIGSHVINQLIADGFDVYASDFHFENVNPRAHFVTTPIFSDLENLYEVLGSPNYIIHLAWRNGFIHNHDSHLSDLFFHYHFLEKMMQAGCKNISVMGTMHEIGYYEGRVDETTPTNPSSLYGISKNTLRQSFLLLGQRYVVNAKWLRGYYIVGDDLRNHSVFSKLLIAEQEGKNIFPFTSGLSQFDFLSIEELAMQIASAATQSEVSGIINICSGIPEPIGQVAEEFIQKHNLHIQLDYGAFPDRPYDSKRIYGDNSKIQLIMKKRFK